MKLPLRPCLALIAVALAAPSPTRAAIPPAPPQAQAACFSILSLPCVGCPSVRSKFCVADPSGTFQSCSETTSNCDPTHLCSQVETATGPACGN